jgi:hypothetical protein
MPVVQITRSHQLKVTMTPEIHARLVALSEKLGQSPATVASMAISQYVNQQEATLGAPQRMVDTMLSQFMPQLMAQMDQLPDAVEIKLPKPGPGWKESQ